MGSIPEHFFDFSILLAIVLVQTHLARLLLNAAGRRFGRRASRALIPVVFVAFLWMLAGFALSFPAVRPDIPAWLSSALRASTYIWVACSGAGWIIYCLLRLIWPALSPRVDPARRRLLHLAGSSVVATPFAAIAIGALAGRTDFRVREIDVPLPALAPDLQGLRLTLLSDIHLSPFLSEAELERVIDMANDTRPDLALVTGDLISTAADPLDACLRQLARLRPASGIWGCLGNHEIYAQAQDYAVTEGARFGITFLRGAHRVLRFGSASLNLAGVDYQSIRQRSRYLTGAERLVIPGAVNILLSHNPDVFPTAARKGYDLTVAGHTHGGQVNTEILHQQWNVARFLTPYVYGLYELGQSRAYVTRGIGTVGLPARLGAPPEVAVLRLRKA
jgi:predicted MPP superfamily phosphohydrolase